MFDRVLNTLLHVFLHISRTSLQWDLLLLTGVQKQPPEVLFKKAVLKNFFKFTGKNLCQSFFFNKVLSKNAKKFVALPKKRSFPSRNCGFGNIF